MKLVAKIQCLKRLLCFQMTVNGQRTTKRGQDKHLVLFSCYYGCGDSNMKSISQKIVYWLWGHQNGYQEKQEIYQYGMMLFLTSLGGIISILLLALFLFNTVDGIVFLLIFCSLRLFSGGYHCKTYLSCFLASNLIFLMTASFASLSYRIELPITICGIIIMACFASIYIQINAPITVSYRRLSQKKYKKNRKKAILLSTTFSIVIIVVAVITKSNTTALHLCTLVATTEMSVSVLMLIQKNIERRKKHA